MSPKRNFKRIPNKKERSKRLLNRLVKVVLITAITLFLIKAWIIPELIRHQIQQMLSKYYDGSIQIKKVQVSSTGKTFVESISLSDKSNHKWLSIDNMKVTLVDWQLLKPVITEIEIAGLNLHINMTDGKLQLPTFYLSPVSSETNKRIDIKKLTIKDASVNITDPNGSGIIYNNLVLSAVRKDNIYQLQLNQAQSDKSEILIVNGKINPQNSDFELSLQIKHHFTKEEVNIPFAALKMNRTSAEGNFAGDMTISGSLKEPIRWQPEGHIQLINWNIESDRTSAQNIINTEMQIDSAGIQLKNLSVSDPNGVELLSTNTVSVTLDNWPGLSPNLNEVEINSPRLLAEMNKSGQLIIPAMPGQNQDTNSVTSFPEIQKMTINDASVVIKNPDDSEVVFDRYFFEAEKQQELYDISIRQLSPEDSNTVLVKGTVKPEDFQVDLTLTISENVPTSQKDFFFELAKLPDFISEGTFSTNLSIKGTITDPIHQITTGTIGLNDWIIKTGNNQILSTFGTIINITERGISLGDISIRDPNGLEWLSAKSSKLILSEKPDSNPVITEIEITDMKTRAQITNGKLQLPVALPMSGTAQTQNDFLDLQRIFIQNASLSLTGPNVPETTLDNLWLELEKQQDSYNIQFARTAPEDSNELVATAIFNPKTSELELTIQADTIIKSNDITIVQSLLNIPRFQAKGRLATDVSISGNIEKPETLQPKGHIELKDWSLAFEDGIEMNNLSSIVRLDGSQLNLENLAVKDINNTEWLTAKTAAITIENWPGLNPVLTEIETEGLTLRTYLIDNKLCLPVDLPSFELTESKTKHIDIRKVTARDITIDIANLKNKRLMCDYLSIQPTEQTGFYEVALTYNKPDQQQPSTILLQGIINPDSLQIDLSLQMNHRATKQETAFIFAALGLPEASGEGIFFADTKISGNLNKPSSLQSNGSLTIGEGILYIRDKTFINNLNTTGKLDNQSLFFEQYNADICSGPATGSLYVEAKPNKKIEIDCTLNADKMNFTELTSIFSGDKRKASKGFVTLNYYFTTTEGNLKSLSGDGQIILDDADISVIPIIPHLFSIMGLVKLDPLKLSDAHCAFGMTGAVMEIRSAHIANTFGAIEAEPGGTINLQTGNINMYVITVPLRQLDVLVRKIPLIDIFFNLRDKLTRFYIRGHWSSPPTKLITKTPIKDIREGTVGFFEDVARNGGHFGKKMLDGFGVILKAGQNNKKQGEKK